MSTISTHVLDTAHGCPARGVPVKLERLDDSGAWTTIGDGHTNADGRVTALVTGGVALTPGTYAMHFDTGTYFEALGVTGFYPYARIVFTIADADQHYHVPLLLSPYGYSTYRGS